MSEKVSMKASYPVLRSVFVVPTLLETGITPERMQQVIPVKDPKELGKLKGGRGSKVAKRWAPLFVHNALFSGVAQDDQSLKMALQEAEDVLGKCGSNSWFSAFREAGEAGVPPSAFIKKMPNGKKQLLNSQERPWKNAAEKVEAILSRWILENPEKVSDLAPEKGETEIEAASLKKMARFKPSA